MTATMTAGYAAAEQPSGLPPKQHTDTPVKMEPISTPTSQEARQETSSTAASEAYNRICGSPITFLSNISDSVYSGEKKGASVSSVDETKEVPSSIVYDGFCISCDDTISMYSAAVTELFVESDEKKEDDEKQAQEEAASTKGADDREDDKDDVRGSAKKSVTIKIMEKVRRVRPTKNKQPSSLVGMLSLKSVGSKETTSTKTENEDEEKPSNDDIVATESTEGSVASSGKKKKHFSSLLKNSRDAKKVSQADNDVDDSEADELFVSIEEGVDEVVTEKTHGDCVSKESKKEAVIGDNTEDTVDRSVKKEGMFKVESNVSNLSNGTASLTDESKASNETVREASAFTSEKAVSTPKKIAQSGGGLFERLFTCGVPTNVTTAIDEQTATSKEGTVVNQAELDGDFDESLNVEVLIEDVFIKSDEVLDVGAEQCVDQEEKSSDKKKIKSKVVLKVKVNPGFEVDDKGGDAVVMSSKSCEIETIVNQLNLQQLDGEEEVDATPKKEGTKAKLMSRFRRDSKKAVTDKDSAKKSQS